MADVIHTMGRPLPLSFVITATLIWLSLVAWYLFDDDMAVLPTTAWDVPATSLPVVWMSGNVSIASAEDRLVLLVDNAEGRLEKDLTTRPTHRTYESTTSLPFTVIYTTHFYLYCTTVVHMLIERPGASLAVSCMLTIVMHVAATVYLVFASPVSAVPKACVVILHISEFALLAITGHRIYRDHTRRTTLDCPLLCVDVSEEDGEWRGLQVVSNE